MSVSKVNDRFYRKFILEHLENKFDIKDLYDVVVALNPANERLKIQSEAERYSSTSHKMDMRIIYDFPTESSAKLFSSTYVNLVQKGHSVFNLKHKGNKVLLEFRDPMIISHRKKDNDIPEAQQKRISDAIAFREESFLMSDIFIKSLDSLFNSGIYKINPKSEFRVNKRVTSVPTFIAYEKLLKQKVAASQTAYYKSVMYNNAIEMNGKMNNKIMSQITTAMNSRVDRLNGALLAKSIFRLSDGNGGLEFALNMKSQVKSILKSADEITQDSVNDKSFISKIISKMKKQPLVPNPTHQPENRRKQQQYKVRYK